jgi:hypothetical protein
MKARLCLLSAAIAVCVLPAAALAQPGGLGPYRPDMSFPPNWQPGPGGTRPVLPSGPLPPNNPLLVPGTSGPGGILPPEPGVGAVLDQRQGGNPNPDAARLAQEAASQLTNPVVPKFEPLFDPAYQPGAARVWHEPPAESSWQGWEWAAACGGGLCLLARVLGGGAARKQTGTGDTQENSLGNTSHE